MFQQSHDAVVNSCKKIEPILWMLNLKDAREQEDAREEEEAREQVMVSAPEFDVGSLSSQQ